MEAFEILKIAANALNEKKAKELAAVKIDEVEEKLSEAGVQPHHIEGKATGWIVLDYGSVIVHVFSRDQREFYALDKMWSDGEQVDLSELLTEVEGD